MRRTNIKSTILIALSATVLLSSCHHHHHEAAQSATALPPVIDTSNLTNIDYVDGSNSKAQTLDLFLPPPNVVPSPLIVYIHGGAWAGGDKQPAPSDALTNGGFACASINYRLTDEAKFPAQIEDCKAAIRWLRANAKRYNLDPNRVGVWGISAGAHLAALLGTTSGAHMFDGYGGNTDQSSDVQAVADWSGPSDLLTFRQQEIPTTRIHADDSDGPVAKFLGGTPNAVPKIAREASPVTYISDKAPPFLILHGTDDDTVPFGQSNELYKALQIAHVKSSFIQVQGAGHDLYNQQVLETTVKFFQDELGKVRSVPIEKISK